MAVTLDNPVVRRLVTIPVVVALFGLVTLLLPGLLLTAVLIDIIRWLVRRSHWISVRAIGFFWVYLLGEIWALIALGVIALFPERPRTESTYRLQETWAAWNLGAVCLLFGLRMTVEGEQHIAPGPIIVLSRHASLIDSLLPANLLSRRHGIRLRYVLKKELLLDPALDIAGNRIPNHFIDRDSRETAAERSAVKSLGSGLGASDGVLIYPEGTRYSEAKRNELSARISGRGGRVGEIAGSLRRVLPPRPAGTLALLEDSDADVVVLAHSGLEGFATVKEIWRGDIVGSRIAVKLWRVPVSQIPQDRGERVTWLFELWSDIDAWVVARGESED
jgi:1-acyl-sn-glycerol-3-phosphate acyltransferase